MRMRFALSLLLSVMLLAAQAGCARPAGSPARFRIAVIPKGTTHDFWKSIHAGAIQAQRERGGVDLVWEGPSKEDQRHEQQQIVERFTSEGIDAIVLAPVDRQTLAAPVEAALKKGIPVVIIDSGIETTEAMRASPKNLGYIATDNRQGGMEAARRMIELLKDKPEARVLMIRYQAGSESTEQREAGFRETIQKAANIKFNEAADEAGATVDSAQKTAERVLSDRPDLDGLFLPNESSATGGLRALEVLGRAGKLVFVGFDTSTILIRGVEEGKLQGLVAQDPFDMGYRAVCRAVDHLEGKPMAGDKVLHTGLAVITRENLHQPSIRALYARDLRPYLGE